MWLLKYGHGVHCAAMRHNTLSGNIHELVVQKLSPVVRCLCLIFKH